MVIKDLAASEYEWIEQFNPEKIVFRGTAYLVAKRIFDLFIVILTMPLWALAIALIALVIWLQAPSAPVFFSQMRTGKGGKRFKMFKFRTMVPNAESLKQKYMHLNELQWPDFKISNDPRVTPLGRFLRKTSLDELPQMANVLWGDMSLVGPRPTSFGPENYMLWHTERLDVQPGLTGLWQVIGRGETEFDDRLRLDIAYVEHRCIALDINILFRTVRTVLLRKGTH